MIWVTAAKYLDNFRVHVEFSDGARFDIDLSQSLKGPMFAALMDVEEFSKVQFDADLDTICWPNGADLAPEYLYEVGKQQSSKSVADANV